MFATEASCLAADVHSLPATEVPFNAVKLICGEVKVVKLQRPAPTNHPATCAELTELTAGPSGWPSRHFLASAAGG